MPGSGLSGRMFKALNNLKALIFNYFSLNDIHVRTFRTSAILTPIAEVSYLSYRLKNPDSPNIPDIFIGKVK